MSWWKIYSMGERRGWGVERGKNPENFCMVFSQIAWRVRHRRKGHRAGIWRKPEAKHCSSLCSQSEGGEYCGGQARAENPQSYAPKRWSCSLRVRGPHFASKVSYSAGAATDDCAGQCNFKHLTYKAYIYITVYSQSASVMRVISSSQSSLSGLISTTRAPISSATRRAVFPLYSFWMNTTRTFSRRHS